MNRYYDINNIALLPNFQQNKETEGHGGMVAVHRERYASMEAGEYSQSSTEGQAE